MEKEEIIAADTQDCATECQAQTTPENESSDTIYDISESSDDSQTSAPVETNELSEPSDESEIKEGATVKEETTPIESPDVKEAAKPTSAEAELQKMLDEVGVDTLLQIIKGNRNAAIRQIITEVESSRDCSLPSGTSSSPSCTSIFDLAALA